MSKTNWPTSRSACRWPCSTESSTARPNSRSRRAKCSTTASRTGPGRSSNSTAAACIGHPCARPMRAVQSIQLSNSVRRRGNPRLDFSAGKNTVSVKRAAAASMAATCNSSREPKCANRPLLDKPVLSASAPIVSDSKPRSLACASAASRMAARVVSPLLMGELYERSCFLSSGNFTGGQRTCDALAAGSFWIFGRQLDLENERRQVKPLDLNPCGRRKGLAIELLPDAFVLDERVQVRGETGLLHHVGEGQTACLQRLLQPRIDRANGRRHVALARDAGNVKRFAGAQRVAKADIVLDRFVAMQAFPLRLRPDGRASREEQEHGQSEQGTPVHCATLATRVERQISAWDYAGNRRAKRSRALAASTSRYLGGAVVSSESRRRPEMAVIASTAARNAGSLGLGGLFETGSLC